jgi:hypothetical protein
MIVPQLVLQYYTKSEMLCTPLLLPGPLFLIPPYFKSDIVTEPPDFQKILKIQTNAFLNIQYRTSSLSSPHHPLSLPYDIFADRSVN